MYLVRVLTEILDRSAKDIAAETAFLAIDCKTANLVPVPTRCAALIAAAAGSSGALAARFRRGWLIRWFGSWLGFRARCWLWGGLGSWLDRSARCWL